MSWFFIGKNEDTYKIYNSDKKVIVDVTKDEWINCPTKGIAKNGKLVGESDDVLPIEQGNIKSNLVLSGDDVRTLIKIGKYLDKVYFTLVSLTGEEIVVDNSTFDEQVKLNKVNNSNISKYFQDLEVLKSEPCTKQIETTELVEATEPKEEATEPKEETTEEKEETTKNDVDLVYVSSVNVQNSDEIFTSSTNSVLNLEVTPIDMFVTILRNMSIGDIITVPYRWIRSMKFDVRGVVDKDRDYDKYIELGVLKQDKHEENAWVLICYDDGESTVRVQLMSLFGYNIVDKKSEQLFKNDYITNKRMKKWMEVYLCR